MEMYKPPGIIQEKQSALGDIGYRSQFKQLQEDKANVQFANIYNTVPSNLIGLPEGFENKQDQALEQI